MQILYFAAVRELMGRSEERLAAPAEVRTVRDLREHLQTVHPALRGRLGSVRFAVNETFATDSEPVSEDDVIALIPPVAGG